MRTVTIISTTLIPLLMAFNAGTFVYQAVNGANGGFTRRDCWLLGGISGIVSLGTAAFYRFVFVL